jgi:hypothetical protein
VDARQDEPRRTAFDQEQTLLNEAVWSVALIGAVIALVLIVRFAA